MASAVSTLETGVGSFPTRPRAASLSVERVSRPAEISGTEENAASQVACPSSDA